MSPWLLVSMLMLLWGFLLFLLCGGSEPPLLQTSSANQIWRAIQPVNVRWWLSRSRFNHQLKKLCYLCKSQKSNFCCSIRDKGKVFVAVLACILRNWSDTSSFEVPGRKLCTIIRHPRGQSEVNRQWTLAFVSSKITHCSRSWFAVLLFMCFHINAFTMTSKKSDTIRNMQTL